MDKKLVFDEIIQGVKDILARYSERDDVLLQVCRLLEDKIDYYNWVGFYVVNPDKADELVLGPYVGAHTDHTHIAFGKGVCGQVAEQQQTRVIQDVSKEDNYLACSLNVKSEIVAPVFKDGKFIAELDIDSHAKGPYTEEDSQYLEKICEMLSERVF